MFKSIITDINEDFTYNVQDREPLKCINHWRRLKDWDIPMPRDGADIHVPRFRAIIE